MTTIATLERISPSALSSILLEQSSSPNPTVAVIDVRDHDHIGGHIRSSLHHPSTTLDHAIPTLVHKLASKDTVVFHCALSQQRGPTAALRYLRERERLLGPASIGQAMKKDKAEELEKKGKNEGGDGKDEEWEDVESKKERKEQKVYVLDRGFVGWQEIYGEDERLTEGYVRDLWKDGYWM